MNTSHAPAPTTPVVDADLEEQARPGFGIPSQDPRPAAQTSLSPEEAKREAHSVAVGGGVMVGASGRGVRPRRLTSHAISRTVRHTARNGASTATMKATANSAPTNASQPVLNASAIPSLGSGAAAASWPASAPVPACG